MEQQAHGGSSSLVRWTVWTVMLNRETGLFQREAEDARHYRFPSVVNNGSKYLGLIRAGVRAASAWSLVLLWQFVMDAIPDERFRIGLSTSGKCVIASPNTVDNSYLDASPIPIFNHLCSQVWSLLRWFRSEFPPSRVRAVADIRWLEISSLYPFHKPGIIEKPLHRQGIYADLRHFFNRLIV